MPRNALHSRNGQPGAVPSASSTTPPPQAVPTIRFTSATPSSYDPSESQLELNMDAYPLPVDRIVPFTAAPLAPRVDPDATPRKKLVPKKSRLALLAAGTKSLGKDKTKTKSRADDLSDVVRRVGASDTGRTGGFEIYVDHCEDAEDASILMVKKKKSRAALDDVHWGSGALGEVTNVGAYAGASNATAREPRTAPNTLKVPAKGDENQNQNGKWWNMSIRGRKEKEKEKAPVRSKTPEPFGKPVEDSERRARFNSLDSTRLLSFVQPKGSDQPPPVPPKDFSAAQEQTPRQRSGTLSSLSALLNVPSYESGADGLLAPPTPVEAPAQNQGSIALRAMRSMARMKSFVNIGSDKTEKEGNNTRIGATTTATSVRMKGKLKKTKEKKKEEKRSERISTSSFEAGTLSSLSVPVPPLPDTINRKPSKLALGGLIPNPLRPSTVRSTSSRVSSASSESRACSPISPGAPPTHGLYALSNPRLSALDSSTHLSLDPNGRPTSAYSMSSGGSSSLRPPSTASRMSRSSGMSASAFSMRSQRSSSSSNASVRWDEDCLQGTREAQRRERAQRRSQPGAQESKQSADPRRRTPVIEIFPEIRSTPTMKRSSLEEHAARGNGEQPPVVTLEEATTDYQSEGETSGSATPVKRARPRPWSEQLLEKVRPKAISGDAEGVISILDAATNDLASLINRLDLEATPSSVQGSPLRPLQGSPSLASLGKAGEGSPLKPKRCTFDKTRDAPTLSERESLESISSLRPYGQVGRTHSDPAVPPTRQQAMDTLDVRRMLIGQRIASWNELESQLSSKRPAAQAQATAKPFRPTHRRMVTPGPEDMDIATMFQPLKPSAKQREASVESLPSTASTPAQGSQDPANPSSQTFGSDAPTSKVGKSPSVDLGYDDAAPPSPSPTTRRRPKHSKRSSVLSVMCDTGATLPRESLISLGLTGTLGGPEPEVDPEDPDSDIPDELQAIMSGQSDDDDTTELLGKMLACKRHDRAPSPGLPPSAALPSLQNETKSEQEQKPVFRASLVSVDSNQTDLDESDVSASEDDTKKSFDFTGELRLLNSSGGSDRRSFVEQLESAFRTPGDISLGLQLGANLFLKDVPPTPALQPEHRRTPDKDMVPQSVTEADVSSFRLSLLSDGQSCRDSATSDTLERLLAECEEDICRPYSMLRKSQSTMRSKASDGRLNTSFKFGGKPSIPDSVEESAELKPLTLSDIIPPASHARSPSQSSLMEGDSSVLKSILGNAYEGDTSVVNSIVAQAQAAAPAVPRPRLDSDSSSKRRARESLDLSNMSRSRTNSELSFKGLESFEEVRRGFEFHPNSRPAFYPPPGAPKSWQSRHESMYSIASMSSLGTILDSGISDPFGYASSRPVSTADELSFAMSSTIDDTFSFVRKGSYRKRVDSDASSFCLRPGAARGQRRNESNIPPISIYNRSFGVHRRIDSNSSMSPSNESMESDFSLGSLARPGLGDKMFDRMEYGMPLAAISASPTGSFFSEQDSTSRRYSDISERGEQQGVSYDSVFDTERRASVTDSIFEKTGMPTSHDVSDDVFEFDLSRPTDSPRLNQFRPISMMSVASTTHSIPRSEDTMISMIGGGHVRRRSIDSRIDDSPCIDLERKEKKKHTALQHIARVLEFDQKPDELPSDFVDRLPKISLDKAHATKPSIASTSSFQLGDEPIIKAGKGLLQRQSLEKDALIAHEEKIAASLAATAVFSLPVPVSRSRSSTVTSSGGETPPLSPSDGCSVSSGSQSSIDIAHLDNLLTAATLPASGIARARSARMRERGTGHRRRLSSARISRSSVYETIQEEEYSYSPSPAKPSTNTTVDHNVTTPKDGSLSRAGSIYIVAPDTESVGEWDDEQGIVGVRKYYALRQEADVAVTESKKVWPDTSFSTFAMQTFELPTTRSAMQAMLEQSQKSYGPLSSELRAHRIRSRTSSRTSPYPVRSRRASVEKQPQALPESRPFASPRHSMNMPLVEISINPNTKNAKVFSPQPARDVQPFSKSAVDLESSKHAVARSPSATRRTRVASSARRAALGWSKRNNAKSNTATIKGSAGTGKGPTSSASVKENFGTIRPSTNSALAKENAGTILSHNESLKISRPRPRGRPAPARAALSRAPLAASQSYV